MNTLWKPGYRRPWGDYDKEREKVTIRHNLLPRLRMRGAVPPIFHMSLWRRVS
jgi:hypothetical protein